jgi:hypothetical protein
MAKPHKLLGNYLGIVVQNNDPQQRGRIKVFVPHLSPSVYKKWIETKNDKKFKFVGTNINSSLNEIMDDLKLVLPWSECASPISGESASGRFNYYSKVGSISDTARLDTLKPDQEKKNDNPDTQNYDNIGEKPGHLYESANYILKDAFNDPEKYHTNQVNKYSFNYKPNAYSNKAKGSFSVPRVGSHVWVFFSNGDIMRPVYFAVSHGEEDWKGIYDSSNEVGDFAPGQDYPGYYENYTLSGGNTFDINVDTYRNKYVINQKGGTIEFVNTDNREVLKMTHFSGSFKEFNNYTNIELATGNDQKLVQQDQFLTVYGFKNLYVERDYDSIIRGDYYKKIGNLNFKPMVEYKEILKKIANVKQLFEIRRAEPLKKGFINLTSPNQTKSGKPAPCPVCAGNKSLYWQLNNRFLFARSGETTSTANAPWSRSGIPVIGPFLMQQTAKAKFGSMGSGEIFGETCPCCGGSGESPSSQNGSWANESRKSDIKQLIENNFDKLTELEKQMGLGGSEIINVTKNKIETIGMDINDLPSTRVDKAGKIGVNEVRVHPEGVFNNQRPTPVVEYVHVDDLPGGTYTLTVGNRYNVMVGAGGINFKSYGPVNISGTITNIAGQQVNIGSDNEVYIDGGQKLQLIADVINIKQRVNQQVAIEGGLGVTGNAVIGGGMHVEGELSVNHITGPTEIQETNRQIVTGTTNNIIPSIIGYNGLVGGGTDIIGYALVAQGPGVPAPVPVFASATGTPGGPPAPVWSKTATGLVPFPDCVVMHAHSHTFKNIPLDLKDSNNAVREEAMQLNNDTGDRIPAKPINNSKK